MFLMLCVGSFVVVLTFAVSRQNPNTIPNPTPTPTTSPNPNPNPNPDPNPNPNPNQVSHQNRKCFQQEEALEARGMDGKPATDFGELQVKTTCLP